MPLVALIKTLLRDPVQFAEHASRLKLRAYQAAPLQAIVDSVVHKRGLSIVVIFPRQSGKNELQAQLETYLLTLYSQLDAELVKASPTWRPQSLNAMRRLERVLKRNLLTTDKWLKREGYSYQVNTARIYFMSAEPHANAVGHTASLLLECDEAQDVMPAKWDKDFAPMAASTNATQVFWGTAWTSRTLLARELRAARAAQARDGIRRAFVLTADQVGREVPEYRAFVAAQVAKLGRDHPLVRTQFFCEEIDAEGGLFGPARRALLQGSHARLYSPLPGETYALLIDVAGEDEGRRGPPGSAEDLSNPGRDATALTVIRIRPNPADLAHRPIYEVINRKAWLGVKHTSLYGEIVALAEHWHAQKVVIDATGVGAGLASFLAAALPGRVIPFVFNAATKSALGWSLVALADCGRLKDYAPDGPEAAEYRQQLEFVQYEAQANQQLRWSVPAGTRDPATGELVHDDWIMSVALASQLETESYGTAESMVIQAPDPLRDQGEY